MSENQVMPRLNHIIKVVFFMSCAFMSFLCLVQLQGGRPKFSKTNAKHGFFFFPFLASDIFFCICGMLVTKTHRARQQSAMAKLHRLHLHTDRNRVGLTILTYRPPFTAFSSK